MIDLDEIERLARDLEYAATLRRVPELIGAVVRRVVGRMGR